MAKLPTGRFPFINLAKSLDRAKSIYENDKGGKGLKVPVAFSAWGYSDKSSGGFQTIAALKAYGLLVDEGANDDRAVKLTSDARQFFQTELEDDKQRLRAKFAGQPSLMKHLLEHWEMGTVADPVARTYLKTAIGLNEQSARSALGIYKENLPFISDKGAAKAPEMEREESHVVADVSEATSSNNQTDAHQPQRAMATSVSQNATYGPELNVVRADVGGYVIHLSGAVMTKAHADEVVTLLSALRATLPESNESNLKAVE